MKAIRIESFGGPEVLQYADIDPPQVGVGEVLVRIHAAGVGPWDAWVRSGQSQRVRSADLPVTPGSDIAGVVVQVGPGSTHSQPGDEVFGVTNQKFTGGYAQFAVASDGMLTRKPRSISFVQAASVPVVAVTAGQMLFEHADLAEGQSALILGASGNVGAYAVQLAKARGIRVLACARPQDADRLLALGADEFVDSSRVTGAMDQVSVDAVIDTVGGDLQERSLVTLRPGGVLVSSVSPLDESRAKMAGIRSAFFIVDVTRKHLDAIATMIDAGTLISQVGLELPLSQARVAHEMLERQRPAPRGKIVLLVA